MTEANVAASEPPSFEMLFRSLQTVVGRTMSPITLRQFAMLVLLEHTGGPIGVDEIAGHLDLYKHAITRICDRMSSMGYISRTINPADNRLRLIEIKPKGRSLLTAFTTGSWPATTRTKKRAA